MEIKALVTLSLQKRLGFNFARYSKDNVRIGSFFALDDDSSLTAPQRSPVAWSLSCRSISTKIVSTSSEASQSIAICSHGSVRDALELDDPSPDNLCEGDPETVELL